MKKYAIIIFSLLFVFFATTGITTQKENAKDTFELVILHTNDFHGYDYEILARKSTLIKQLRSENRNVLLLEGGDIFSRGEYHHVFYGLPEMAVLNALRYDAWVIGNNELKCAKTVDSTDYYIKQLVDMAQFPSLCGNLLMRSNERYFPGVEPYIIVERDGLKIAIISTTSIKARGYMQARNKILIDPLLSARQQLAEVLPKSDIRILLSHSGILADKIMGDSLGTEGLDAIVGADTHLVLEKPFISSSGVPIVQAGGDQYQYVGVLRLTFRKEYGVWKRTSCDGELLKPSENVKPDTETKEIVNTYIKK